MQSFLPTIMPFLGALLGALVALWVSWASRKNDMKKLIEDNLRKRKIELYDEFAKFLGEGIYKTVYNERDEKEFEKQMFIFNHRAIMWMSDDVLKSYILYKDTARIKVNNSVEQAKLVTNAYLNFIQKMREDCGHKNIGVDSDNLVKLFIRDKVS
jgi:hypothetical protein